MSALLVAPCEPRAARHAVEHWHYSERMPTPPCATYGVWEADRFVGAVVFSPGAAPHLPGQFQLGRRQLVELTRVALRDHVAPVSQIVTQAVAAMRRDSPGIRLIVSFADPAQGHRGGIYQAMNWLYLGQTAGAPMYRDARGRLFHSRVVSPTGFKRQYGELKRVPKTTDLTKVEMPGKHRYVLPLDRAMRRQVVKLAQPYPQQLAVEASTATRSATG